MCCSCTSACRGRSASSTIGTSPSPPLSHDHVVFQMSSGARVVYNDPRRFGSMDLVRERDLSSHAALRTLGPEPLAAGFDPAVLAAACRGKRTSLKAALSDQRVVAGLGNIYVCEALHRARLSPRRRASSIVTRAGAPREAAARLAAAIRLVLAQAIRPARRGAAPGEVEFRVYDREGQGCHAARLPRRDPEDRAGRALDLLLPGVPAMTQRSSSATGGRATSHGR